MSPSMVAFTDFNWMFRFWATAAMPAVRQLASPTSTYSTGVAPLSSEAKTLRMIGIELEGGLAALLLAQTVEAFDGRMAVRAILPFAGRAPLELRGLRSLGESVARVEQSLDVDAIVGGRVPSAMMGLPV